MKPQYQVAVYLEDHWIYLPYISPMWAWKAYELQRGYGYLSFFTKLP